MQESALLRLAERQAGREEELAEARKRAQEAEVRAEDLAQDLTLLQQQVAALKEVTAKTLLGQSDFMPFSELKSQGNGNSSAKDRSCAIIAANRCNIVCSQQHHLEYQSNGCLDTLAPGSGTAWQLKNLCVLCCHLQQHHSAVYQTDQGRWQSLAPFLILYLGLGAGASIGTEAAPVQHSQWVTKQYVL